ncbi:hypothetical protein D3C87_1812630 [compost metagenome]
MQQIAIERNAVIQQPVERCARQARHHRLAQGHDVVLADFALEQRPFTDPPARGHSGQRGHLAFRVTDRNLDQTGQYTNPSLGEFTFALYDRSGNHLLHGEVALDARLLLAIEHAKPRRGKLKGVG